MEFDSKRGSLIKSYYVFNWHSVQNSFFSFVFLSSNDMKPLPALGTIDIPALPSYQLFWEHEYGMANEKSDSLLFLTIVINSTFRCYFDLLPKYMQFGHFFLLGLPCHDHLLFVISYLIRPLIVTWSLTFAVTAWLVNTISNISNYRKKIYATQKVTIDWWQLTDDCVFKPHTGQSF